MPTTFQGREPTRAANDAALVYSWTPDFVVAQAGFQGGFTPLPPMGGGSGSTSHVEVGDAPMLQVPTTDRGAGSSPPSIVNLSAIGSGSAPPQNLLGSGGADGLDPFLATAAFGFRPPPSPFGGNAADVALSGGTPAVEMVMAAAANYAVLDFTPDGMPAAASGAFASNASGAIDALENGGDPALLGARASLSENNVYAGDFLSGTGVDFYGGAIVIDLGAAGTVIADGNSDKAIRGDVARSTYGLDGTGIKIGILSDSFNAKSGYNDDVTAGNLPNNVTVLAEGTGADEGRAMAQLVYKVAPGAQLYFATAVGGQQTFADNITALKNAGCQIILDDFIYFAEPYYQLGDPIENAIDAFVSGGGHYFTMAFNDGNGFYENTFNPISFNLPGVGTKTVHDFGGGNPYEKITMANKSGSTSIYMQWEQPFTFNGNAGSTDSLSFYVFDENHNFLFSVDDDQTGDDPVQGMFINNLNGAVRYIAVANDHGPAPDLFKMVIFGDGNGTVFNGPGNGVGSGTITGHNLDPSATTVAAVDYQDTPEFGTTPPVVEDFSGFGPAQLLFDVNGNALATPLVLNKPDVAAPDGSVTSTLNPFFGTSAATPNAGAVAALMLQANNLLNSLDIRYLLMDSAIVMADHDSSGSGLIQADKAVGYAVTLHITQFAGGNTTLFGTHLADTITGGSGADILIGDGGGDTFAGNGGDNIYRDTTVHLDGDTVIDLHSGDSFDVTDLSPVAASASYDASTGLITIKSLVATVATITGPQHLNFTFTTQSDGAGGTTINVACFCRGTPILTERGECPVESLGVGDRVVTASGELRPIRWIGHRAYHSRFVGSNPAILPVRIAAGSLAEDVPACDLRLSPEHALYVDGCLVAARLLLNGSTIVQMPAGETLEYFHIELDGHDVIFAAGAPAETYIERDNLGMFENAAERGSAMLPSLAPQPFCALRLDDGCAELAAIRTTVANRAQALNSGVSGADSSTPRRLRTAA